MSNQKKNVFNILFLFFVFGLTVYGVFKGKDVKEVLRIMKGANPFWLGIGILSVIVFIWGESIIIYYLMKTLSISLKKWTCFLFSSVGFFFSCITPSATGGQPMQIYYMCKKKIPIPVSTLSLMIVTITYKFVLVVIGLAIICFGQGFIRTYLMDIRYIFYLGIGLNVFSVSFMWVLAFHPMLARRTMMKGLELLERLHLLKQKETRVEKLEHAMDLYNETAVFFKAHMHVIWNVLVVTFGQRIVLFMTTYFVYRSFGLTGKSLLEITMLQAVISVSVDMLPLPGGMGVSENLFLTIFVPIFGKSLILPGMLLSRGIGYYAQLLISAIMTVVAQFTIRSERGTVASLEKEKVKERGKLC